MSNNLLEVMPEQYYYDTLKPHMDNMLANCKYDAELIRNIEGVINFANQYAARKSYPDLQDAFNVLGTVLGKDSYRKSKIWLYASQEEKKMVDDLVTYIQELYMIIKCTKPEPVEAPAVRERLGYDASKKENVGIEDNKPQQTRRRF